MLIRSLIVSLKDVDPPSPPPVGAGGSKLCFSGFVGATAFVTGTVVGGGAAPDAGGAPAGVDFGASAGGTRGGPMPLAFGVAWPLGMGVNIDCCGAAAAAACCSTFVHD